MDERDLPYLSRILQDSRVMYAYNGPFSEEETLAWLKKQQNRYLSDGFGLWGVWLKQNSEMIGQCGITWQEYENRQIPEIGNLLAYDYWHLGYASEAAVACREYGFQSLHFDELFSIIRDSNTASQKVALLNGMKAVGKKTIHYRGVCMPHIVFRTTKTVG